MLDGAYAVIMAGGKGERFWPLSTSQHPKQVLSLIGDKPMLAMAMDYVKELIPPERVIVITSEELVDTTCNAVPALPRENVIGEPVGRDTAACVALASAIVEARHPGGAFCILTADHVIGDLNVFQETIREGFDLAMTDDVLITIGIHPTFPSTGFGYIESGDKIKSDGLIEFFSTKRFVEKPDLATAEDYIASGHFCWNSGMFIWSVKSIQDALGTHQPELLKMANVMQPMVDTEGFSGTLADEYSKLERVSIDYAIMERADNIVMAKGLFQWDDVGSWPAIENHFPSSPDGNVFVGTCEAINSERNLVVSRGRLTALIGVSDLVVVQAENSTLICKREDAQRVKDMVQHLKAKGGYEDVL